MQKGIANDPIDEKDIEEHLSKEPFKNVERSILIDLSRDLFLE